MTSAARIDLDSEALDLGSHSRFMQAASQARRLRQLLVVFAIVSLSLVAAVIFLQDSLWRTLSCVLAAGAMLLAAALLSTYRVVRWRAQAIVVPTEAITVAVPSGSRFLTLTALAFSRVHAACKRAAHSIGGEMGVALCVGVIAVCAVAVIRIGWTWQLAPSPLGMPAQLVGAALLLLAFCLLAMERHLSARDSAEWPEALRLAQYSRLLIGILLVAALCLFLSDAKTHWPLRLAVAMSLVPAAIAVELALRAVLALFTPRNDSLEPALLADSILISLLRWPPRPAQLLHNELFTRFGIDLRQNWAFAYMRRASLPVLGVVGITGWLLTGVHEIPLEGRGIYERFGRPTSVWKPGLHVGLPWPVGQVRAVEFGVVHELAATVTGEVSDKARNSGNTEVSGAEDPPPLSANRLWDASHVAENSQVIASDSGGTQTFHIVNMDVRFIYRVAADDEAALAATYNSADLPTLMRSSANRVLVQYFASRTLDGVLGAKRADMASDIGAAVQADLTRLSTGVEILQTMVESIHPPAGAANSYHAVQAAQIIGQASIARARGTAAEEINTAKMRANLVANKAAASARETKAAAEAVNLRFAAERSAHKTAGKAFATELYLAQLSRGLSQAQLVVLDHRIGGGVAPTIDLRKFSGDSGERSAEVSPP